MKLSNFFDQVAIVKDKASDLTSTAGGLVPAHKSLLRVYLIPRVSPETCAMMVTFFT